MLVKTQCAFLLLLFTVACQASIESDVKEAAAEIDEMLDESRASYVFNRNAKIGPVQTLMLNNKRRQINRQISKLTPGSLAVFKMTMDTLNKDNRDLMEENIRDMWRGKGAQLMNQLDEMGSHPRPEKITGAEVAAGVGIAAGFASLGTTVRSWWG